MLRTILDRVFSRIRHGAFTIDYWGEERKTYGTGAPSVTVRFKSPAVLRKLARNLTIGFGEEYARGNIEIEGDIESIWRIVKENRDEFRMLDLTAITHRMNRNRIPKQAEYIQFHYDTGNDFFKLWLGNTLTYSCAYWITGRETLDEAQENKFRHVLRKANIKQGQRVLDIGSGWGRLAVLAAREYDVEVLGITLSKQQLASATAYAAECGLSDRVKFELRNYHDLPALGRTFDRIVSVGMFEHVGRKNYPDFFKVTKQVLAEDGIMVLHTMSQQLERPIPAFMDKYIVPGSELPSHRELLAQLPEHDLRLIDLENLRRHYARTLHEWYQNFARHKEQIAKEHGEFSMRIWDLFLASTGSSFSYGPLDLLQVVISNGLALDYPMTRHFLYKDQEATKP